MRFILVISFFISLLSCTHPVQEQTDQTKKRNIRLQISELQSPTVKSLRGIWVVDSQTVWISGAGGTILLTLDAGKSWKVVNAPDKDSLDYRDVHAFSATEALVMSAGFPARIYRTTNAGGNWSLVYENLDSSAFMNSVHFKDSTNGLIVGDVLGGFHFVLESHNAGVSWQRIDSSFLPKPLQREHAFAASGSCITTNERKMYLIAFGGEQSRVLREPLDGLWEIVQTPMDDTSSSSGIYSIAKGNDRIMVVGGDYLQPFAKTTCFYSDSSGRDWKAGGILGGYRSVVAYSEKDNLWLSAGTNGLDLSTDAGLNWEKVSSKPFNTLQFDGIKGQAWAAGPKGQLYFISIQEIF